MRLIILLSFFCFGLNAQIKKEIFESFKLQERRDISYYFPEDYSDDKKYLLILVLDADYLFDLMVSNSRFYTKYYRMPESIVVGVHQETDDLRWEDCDFEQTTGLPTEKGKLFYEFLGTELIPYLETSYNIAPFKMFVGYDITANFGNYFLFKNKSLFNSYLIISPILATEMESRIPSRLAELDQEIFYNLVLEKEHSEDRDRILQMNNAISAMDKENLHYFFDEYQEPDHTSIATYGISKAIDNMFKHFRPITPKEYKEQLLTSKEPVIKYLKDKYAMIKRTSGFEKEVILNDVMAIYAASLKKKDYESLNAIANIAKKRFPDAMLGFYMEGEYLEFIGKPKKALKAFEKSFILEEIDFLTKSMAYEKIEALKEDFGF